MTTPVDVLIIGAGASGAAVAWSLAETKMHILCLEQGDWMKPSEYPSTARDWEARQFNDFHISPKLAARLPSIGGRSAGLAEPPLSCFFHPRCAFAEARCRAEPQALLDAGSGRSVRCWKYDATGNWPSAAPPGLTRSWAVDGTLVQAVGLRKRFPATRGLAALNLDWPGRLPRLRYRPTYTTAVDHGGCGSRSSGGAGGLSWRSANAGAGGLDLRARCVLLRPRWQGERSQIRTRRAS